MMGELGYLLLLWDSYKRWLQPGSMELSSRETPTSWVVPKLFSSIPAPAVMGPQTD
jgi:hypothetical protein